MRLFKFAFIRMMLICFTFFSVFSPSSLSVMAAPSAKSSSEGHEETTPRQTQSATSNTAGLQLIHTPVTAISNQQDLAIRTKVENGDENTTVTLFYQTSPDLEWKAKTLTKENNDEYSGTISAAEYVGTELSYYIEAKSGEQTTYYPANKEEPVQVTIQAAGNDDPQKNPKLLITEVVPDSTNTGSSDGYEFIEIYNNSNHPVSLQDYQIIYRYPAADHKADAIWEFDDNKTIPAQSSLVVWIKNGSNEDKTLADFNNIYKSNVSEDKMTTIHSAGMANTAERTIIIADKFNNEISSARYGKEDVVQNKGIQYKVVNGQKQLVNIGLSNPANPGKIIEGQVPAEPVQVSHDTQPPVIMHTPVTKGKWQEDIKIEAKVTDNEKVVSVVLSYRFQENGEYKSIPMELSNAETKTYSAIIPKESIFTNEIFYKIEAFDGIQKAETEEQKITIDSGSFDAQKLPPLLITELVPDSTNVNGLDGYEFIEIYNNSSKDINLKDYKIRYRYPMDGPEADLVWRPEKEDIILPAGKTMVFWIINKGNTDKTVADFNAHYGTQLVENETIVKMNSNGMSNTNHNGIVIATNTGHDVAAAYYNDELNVKDTAPDKGIFFTFPRDGSRNMKKYSSTKERATPGQVAPVQVPDQPVNIPGDHENPTFEDLTTQKQVSEYENVQLLFDAKDNQQVKTVRLFYKDNQAEKYKSVDLLQDFNDNLYHYTIYSPELIGKAFMEYYLVISDGTNDVTTEKRQIAIIQEEKPQGIRLNVTDGTILNKTAIIKASSDAISNTTIRIDSKNVTAETKPALEDQAYFAVEVKKTNLYFKNGITIGDDILLIFDDTVNQYVTLTVPIDPKYFAKGKGTTISVRSGTKVSPFDTESEENRDDFYIKNARLVLKDGTVLYDSSYADPEKEISVGDGASSQKTVDFTFMIPDEKYNAKAYVWDTTKEAEGTHVIQAADGQNTVTANVKVDNSAPMITPSVEEGKEYKGEFTIDAETKDEIAGVSKVEATLDGKPIDLPFAASSAELSKGKHTLVLKAVDHVGNAASKTITFSTVEEHPFSPEVISPKHQEENVPTSPKLKVKVSDPTKDDLHVAFFKGYQYQPGEKELSVYQNDVDREPPKEMVPNGETAITGEELKKLEKADSKYVVTKSTNQFPYQRFQVKLDKEISANDEIQFTWKGKSLLGRKVTMYAWNYAANKWEALHWKVAENDENFTLQGTVKGTDYVKDQTVQVMVQDEIASTTQFDYTFVWMSDTQYYSESYPHIFKRMTEWIAEKQQELNIQYVFHTGDLVDEAEDEMQWKNANEAMSVLDQHNIPYGVLAGNHDVGHKTGDYNQYSKYFGEERFKGKDYYGESYKNNRGHYDLISVNGNDFIMIYMGWGVNDEDIAWINEVLAKYPDRMAILNFHEYLLVSGNRSPIGDKIYEKVVVPNKNVIAVLCGHYHDSETLISEIDDDKDGTPDRKVYQILADYQGGPEGGQGFMRLLHVNPVENKIYVKTYSPYLNKYNYYDSATYPGKDEFVMEMNLTPQEKVVATDKFAVDVFTNQKIGEVAKVKDNETAEVEWKNLSAEKEYGWYVTVTDDFKGKTRSPIWTFTTAKQMSPPGSGDHNGSNPPPSDDKNPNGQRPPVDGEVILPENAMSITEEVMQDGTKKIIATLTKTAIEDFLSKETAFDTFTIMLHMEKSRELTEVRFPSDMIELLHKKNRPSVIQVETGNGTYNLPIKEFNLSNLAKQLNTSADQMQMAVRIDNISDKEGVLQKHRLTAVSNIIDFTVLISAGQKEIELNRFTQPIKRSIKLKNKVNVNRATVIRLNEDGTVTALPTYFNGNEAVFRSMTNSKYAVIEHYQTFSDIQGLWNKEDVEKLASKWIIHGRKDGTYGPLEDTKRIHLAVLLTRSLGLAASKKYDGRFTDVKGDEWFAEELMAAVEAGIIKGKEDGRFAPYEPVTREQAAAMISRAMQYVGYNKQKLDAGKSIENYKDFHAIGIWARDDVELLLQAGIMKGRVTGEFAPRELANRSHIAAILNRFLVFVGYIN
ncbi:S-layer homology domain-containing protein [Parageobacillus thermoglucosidasius]|uniref:S-layer homology domain-containing protein n=1 Tax=Parageobacillus thermoglucosidasius TaxID=1426 RepID=A0AB38R125_PARTM|nr:S-layer homology domain-containing protein [Parageobacillus thermoglucosidasius]UOE76100.1 S-layer homology domain-containing protein [Parageobacillus thermoglucosidasius]